MSDTSSPPAKSNKKNDEPIEEKEPREKSRTVPALTQAIQPALEDDKGRYIGPVEIYKLTAPNGKAYIGQTQSYTFRAGIWRPAGLEQRWRQHCRPNMCRRLSNAIMKYGADNFQKEVLMTVPKSEADFYETKSIATYNTLSPNGLNLTSGGTVMSVSEEARGMMSESAKSRKRTREEDRARHAGLMKTLAIRSGGLPALVRYIPADPKSNTCEGYRVGVRGDDKMQYKLFSSQYISKEDKLKLAVSWRDDTLHNLGLPPLPSDVVITPEDKSRLNKVYDESVRRSKTEATNRRWSMQRAVPRSDYSLPCYITRNGNGYRARVSHKGKMYRKGVYNKELSSEENLRLTVKARDEMLEAIGLPPIT